MLAELTESRLIFVTGKGGVGKTSFSAALGLASPKKRTLIVEVDNFHPSLTPIFGVNPEYKPKMISDRLGICNLNWKNALEDWLYRTIPMRRIVRLVQKNKVAMIFLDATPGAREIVILSKIIDLLEQWDQVIVDLPASGHALGILRVPLTAKKLMKSGPISARAKEILSVISQDDTRLVLVSIPEEMVVNETQEFLQKIKDEVPELKNHSCILNRVAAPSFIAEEIELLSRLEKNKNSSAADELLKSGRWEQDLERSTAIAQERLLSLFKDQIFNFSRFGLLGGFEGGPAKVVRQMNSAILREIGGVNKS